DTDYSDLNRYKITKQGEKTAIIALGDFYQMGEDLAELIEKKTGTAPTLINPRFITGIDEALLDDLKKNHDKVITLEDGILDGGFGEKIARYYGSSDVKVWCYGLKKEFIDRYSVEDVLKANHLTPEQIYSDIF
ncbi:MAG: 1-deoxy-D-xylulose-5-phosphate synthase, partial [Oscillospiraceae bacterium]|nr:1-deoxy-D-xylulose-5-phosphate synthase [Oscillospiraceae bacterium]